jgi:hypothetical protein
MSATAYLSVFVMLSAPFAPTPERGLIQDSGDLRHLNLSNFELVHGARFEPHAPLLPLYPSRSHSMSW